MRELFERCGPYNMHLMCSSVCVCVCKCAFGQHHHLLNACGLKRFPALHEWDWARQTLGEERESRSDCGACGPPLQKRSSVHFLAGGGQNCAACSSVLWGQRILSGTQQKNKGCIKYVSLRNTFLQYHKNPLLSLACPIESSTRSPGIKKSSGPFILLTLNYSSIRLIHGGTGRWHSFKLFVPKPTFHTGV